MHQFEQATLKGEFYVLLVWCSRDDLRSLMDKKRSGNIKQGSNVVLQLIYSTGVLELNNLADIPETRLNPKCPSGS